MSDSLRKRILTAVVLGAALLVILLALPPGFALATIAALVLGGAWEWSGFLRVANPLLRGLYVVLVALLLLGAWHLSAATAGRDLVIGVAVIWWVLALLWVTLRPRSATPIAAAVAGLLALVPAGVALMRMRMDVADGAQWVVFALVLVFTADIGAYFGGRHFGRVKLAPQVSPGKTWEGVFGGLLFAGAFALCGAAWFHQPALVFVPLCLATVAFSIVGDLTESMLKRFAGLKDSGTLLPGHGGLMDRIDSITAAAPVLYFGMTRLGVFS